MVSVVICSINKMLAAQVEKNIDETIGVPWQLILTDNLQLNKGISWVYNQGAQQAQYDIVCFVHEDVLFQTPSWGRTIVSYFENNPQLGIVGVAGGKYKGRALSGWWNGIPATDCSNILYVDPQEKPARAFANPDPSVKSQDVVTVDGVFMCTPKKVWESVKFDESLIDGFHFYDIDFSFRISRNYQAAVSYEIDILHLTRWGNFGDAWLELALKWHARHKQQLPAMVNKDFIVSKMELRIYRNWLMRLKDERISFGNKLKWIFSTAHWLNPLCWPHIGLFLFPKTGNRISSLKGIRK
ncbi:MAG: glycosyltransferase [Chitinophagaceae bacterium]